VVVKLVPGPTLDPMQQCMLHLAMALPHTLRIYKQVAHRLPRFSMGFAVAAATHQVISTATSVGSFSMERGHALRLGEDCWYLLTCQLF
jgi:hypothetical protein